MKYMRQSSENGGCVRPRPSPGPLSGGECVCVCVWGGGHSSFYSIKQKTLPLLKQTEAAFLPESGIKVAASPAFIKWAKEAWDAAANHAVATTPPHIQAFKSRHAVQLRTNQRQDLALGKSQGQVRARRNAANKKPPR